MRHDYVNFGFDRADVIVAVGYELQEFDPVRINPTATSKIIHIHRFPAEVDRALRRWRSGLQADISRSLDALAAAVGGHLRPGRRQRIRALPGRRARAAAARTTASRWRRRASWPTPGQRSDREDIVLVDTGALKMWMARLYPTYAPNTCLISNGLSTMAWTVPGAIGAKIARPDAQGPGGDRRRRVPDELAGDRDRAPRAASPIVILIWVDDAYGLISWKMDLELGHDVDTRSATRTSSPTPRASAPAGYRITSADELLPTLAAALADDTVSVIACPVDYTANLELIRTLGDLDESLS